MMYDHRLDFTRGLKFIIYTVNKDENVHRYAVRGKRKRVKKGERERDRDSVGNTQW